MLTVAVKWIVERHYCGIVTHTDENGPDEFPAESPVESRPEADHLVDIVHQAVDA